MIKSSVSSSLDQRNRSLLPTNQRYYNVIYNIVYPSDNWHCGLADANL